MWIQNKRWYNRPSSTISGHIAVVLDGEQITNICTTKLTIARRPSRNVVCLYRVETYWHYNSVLPSPLFHLVVIFWCGWLTSTLKTRLNLSQCLWHCQFFQMSQQHCELLSFCVKLKATALLTDPLTSPTSTFLFLFSITLKPMHWITLD